jgi:hypothetical protein
MLSYFLKRLNYVTIIHCRLSTIYRISVASNAATYPVVKLSNILVKALSILPRPLRVTDFTSLFMAVSRCTFTVRVFITPVKIHKVKLKIMLVRVVLKTFVLY